jgi:hypothetical protein
VGGVWGLVCAWVWRCLGCVCWVCVCVCLFVVGCCWGCGGGWVFGSWGSCVVCLFCIVVGMMYTPVAVSLSAGGERKIKHTYEGRTSSYASRLPPSSPENDTTDDTLASRSIPLLPTTTTRTHTHTKIRTHTHTHTHTQTPPINTTTTHKNTRAHTQNKQNKTKQNRRGRC